MWFGEDKQNKHHKDTCLKKIGLRHQLIWILTLYSTLNLIERTHVSNEETNKHALTITVIELGVVQFSYMILASMSL